MEKHLNNSFPPRQLEAVPLLPEGLRSLIIIALALPHSEKSAATKTAQIFLSTRWHSSILHGRSCRV
eukprot:CCRYP_011630-RA/>CCRYP_011630-RA protein AED:0.25 eAED:1.00 QI:0/-1/0/1/-1/0/1/0/66